MWLVVDSGSTKTEWILFNQFGLQQRIFSSGLNPLFLSQDKFCANILSSIPANWCNIVTEFWFYGAGCGTGEVKIKTQFWLKSVFTVANIMVESDLLAAARATCGNNKGVVAILGTGSNSCVYDGQAIKEHIKPLGFILGDEGSGAALGKALLKQLLRNQLSPKLSAAIYKDLGMEYDEIITKVYRSDWPNRFVASCSKVLHAYKKEEEISNIIENEIDAFTRVLRLYKSEVEVYLVGSIAFYFEEYIRVSLNKYGLTLKVVLKSPGDSLVNYHLRNHLF